MPVTVNRLYVYPNPWSAIDEKGRPCGTVPRVETDPARRWVGAKPRAKQIAPRVAYMVKTTQVVAQEAQHDVTWEYSSEKVAVPRIPYYMQAVKNGDLIAADRATAVACNLKRFTDPALHVEHLKALAIKEFDARNGAGAFSQLAELLPKPKQEEPEKTPEEPALAEEAS